jgi:hypothetical protein
VATGPATLVNGTGSNLTGVINPHGQTTKWWFQWGQATSYGEQTTPQAIAATSALQNVSWSLQGLLAPGTIYHYRLVASHSGSATSYGADSTFMTFPSPRPVPRVRAATKPRHARRRPYGLTTSGTVGPTWVPSAYACSGNLTIRFFRGTRQVGFTIAGLQPDCKFSARTVFKRLPGRRRHRPVHLRVVIRFLATGYMAGNRAPIEHVTLG